MIDFAQITNHRFTETSKSLQLQLLGAHSSDLKIQDTGFADAFGNWAMIAIPEPPTTDPQGKITVSAEAVFAEYGDEHVLLGTRDVRVSKFAQDVKPGEVAILNSVGFRLFLGKKRAALVAGGGYLSFDVEKRSLALVGIPATPGGAAPYITISPTIIGLVSATGGCSITLSDGNLSINAATLSIAAGRIDLGTGATDPVVTISALQQAHTQLMTWAAAIVAKLTSVGATGVPPLQLIITPGKHVFAPRGG